MKRVLLIGSGAIKVAEAAEFDYSGSQALKALKEEGLETIIVNPNVATFQTTHKLADKVYMVPLNLDSLTKVIENERPDGILLGFGGQTALTLGVELEKKGVLRKYSIKVLGTQVEGIEKAISREKFRQTMIEAKLPIPPSKAVRSIEGARKAIEELKLPVMVRVSFNLGGRGSSVIWREDQIDQEISRALAQSHIGEVLIEKYLHHWKELEYEVIRDIKGNSAVVACIENLDPMGIHTGESIVITPCQTLDNYEYQEMRSKSISVAESIGLIGEANVQFALEPNSYQHYIIETNPRMSRSSALASKATGYPLAYVAAKLALGYTLNEVINKVTNLTCACFEPSLDYVVIKIPRWDLEKFERIETSLGTEMKSIGEVMAIGRNFEEAMQKAVRMLEIGEEGLACGEIYDSKMTKQDALNYLRSRHPYWFLYVAKAFKENATVDEVYDATGIDKFFLIKIKDLVRFYEELKSSRPAKELLERAKSLGFSDGQIAKAWNLTERDIREMRRKWCIARKVKIIDTLAGEWPTSTNYSYTTFNGIEDDINYESEKGKRKVLVLGAGTFRIGVSVEFDWAVVSLVDELRRRNIFDKTMILNYNPETVSTDWDFSDRLYFDEITVENVLDIVENENAEVIAFVGGQTSNNIAKRLEAEGVKLFGHSGESVDRAENRAMFSSLLEELGIEQPPWIEATSVKDIIKFAESVGYPLLVRPSYVISGSSMKIAWNESELMSYIRRAIKVSKDKPVVVSKFIEDAIEAEIDGVSDGKGVYCIVLEHIESSGIHSGDATITIPYRKMKGEDVKKALNYAYELSKHLEFKGPFNLQFLVKENKVYVIELNLRASRSMPFSSKSTGFNLIRYSVDAISKGFDFDGFREIKPNVYSVKSPQFSWAQLRGAYPFLGPEMRSTGEVASMDFTFEAALIKSWVSSTPNKLPEKDSVILIYGPKRDEDKLRRAGENLEGNGYRVMTISDFPVGGFRAIKIQEARNAIRAGIVGMVIATGYMPDNDYKLRRLAADFNVPLVLESNLALEISNSIKANPEITYLEVQNYLGKKI